MTAIDRGRERQANARRFAELSRESKTASSLLAELGRQFDGQDWIDPGQLGRAYEAQLARQKTKQRATGSFYTPDYLVDFVVEKTLQPLVEGRNIDEICQLRILDPSCGGGAFLLGALRFMEAQCVRAGSRPGKALRRRLCATLVGVDLDPGAIEVTRAALALAVGGSRSAPKLALHVGDALLPETKTGPVHAIVGNPPWGQKGLRIDKATRARYAQLYATASGVWDPFKLFVERCHQLLAPAGRWGLVLPDIVLLKNLQCVRDLILQGSAIEQLAHCGQAFAGANIDAVAIVASRVQERVGPEHQLCVWPHLPPSWQEEAPAHHWQHQAVFHELPGHRFNLYLHGAALDLYRRLLPLPRMGNHLEMHEGVHSGNIRAKLFLGNKNNSECRKLILGRKELARFRLRWQGGWIDTSDKLVDKTAGDYANLGRPEWHRGKKIVVRRTGDRLIAAYDGQGYYVSNNMFVLLPTSEGSEEECMALVALLNSAFMTWYFRAVQPRTGRLFAELKLVHLREFPLPDQEQWRAHVPELARLSARASLSDDAELVARIDELVERLFEISPAERDLIKLLQ